MKGIGTAQLACICICLWCPTAPALEDSRKEPSRPPDKVDLPQATNEPENLQAPDDSAARPQAMHHLRILLETAESALAMQAADLLIEALYDDGKYTEAYEIAQIALKRSPDSALAYRFSRIPPATQNFTGFSVDLGYRLEYDDNITFPDGELASGQEDFRHVLMADLLYQQGFSGNWNFYAQGHLLQSFYNDFDQFNQTRLIASAAIGQQSQKWGWRFPLEASHDRLDGDAFRTSLAAVPGVYLQFGRDYFSHFYIRLQHDDYENPIFANEDRSGDVSGGGVLLAGNPTTEWKLRAYLEFNRYDTDGLYWQRDEVIAFFLVEFEFKPDWTAGLAMRYQDRDYDNVRPVFAQRQQDEVKELFLNLTHKFTKKWRWRAQLSLADHQSNIPIFDYTRNVYSIGVSREF